MAFILLGATSLSRLKKSLSRGFQGLDDCDVQLVN